MTNTTQYEDGETASNVTRKGEDIWGFEPYMQAFLPLLKQQIDFIAQIPHQESKEVTTSMLARRLANLAYATSYEREHPMPEKLLTALKAVLPYAEAELAALQEGQKRDGGLEDEVAAAEAAVWEACVAVAHADSSIENKCHGDTIIA